MAIEKDDWRLFGQEAYLSGKKLKFTSFSTKDSDDDHRHCDFCWAKFSNYDGDLHEGYVEAELGCWICEECFEDFKEMFHWIVVDRKS